MLEMATPHVRLSPVRAHPTVGTATQGGSLCFFLPASLEPY